MVVVSREESVRVFSGEGRCLGIVKSRGICGKKTYFMNPDGSPVCGRHRVEGSTRLPVNVDRKKKENLDRFEEVGRVSLVNQEEGRRGTVKLGKLRMMSSPRYTPGYLPVFPNYLHGGREDGFGCPSLSPKSMGPIDHGQPGLPPALNLENLHQGNKVFGVEMDVDGNPSPEWYSRRVEMYLDPTPRRHKFGDKKTHMEKTRGATNSPMYSIFVGEDGEEKRYTYVGSRVFYCTFYEEICRESEDFRTLRGLLDEGVNLEIFGYDAYDPEGRTMEECYLDGSRPFGHELVLYTMLVCDPEDYPWKKYDWRK